MTIVTKYEAPKLSPREKSNKYTVIQQLYFKFEQKKILEKQSKMDVFGGVTQPP